MGAEKSLNVQEKVKNEKFCLDILKTGRHKRLSSKIAGLQGFTKPQAKASPLAKAWVSPSGFQGKGEDEYMERSKAGVERKVSRR